MSQTDEEIMVLVQAGDKESFGILVERYEYKIQRYAKKFLFGREDVQDLVQEVFIKAYVNIQSFDRKQRFSPWLYRIAHNQFVNALVKRQYQKLDFFDLDTFFPHLVAKETADDQVDKTEIKRLIDLSLHDLDVKYREPLILFFFEDMDYKSIADILKIPVSTVGVRISRGKKIIKNNGRDLDLYYK